jgi:Mrp family chromosome partitioning ATPase
MRQAGLTPIGDTFPFRIAVGLGDAERERDLLPALAESGEFTIVARCLAADQLLAQIHDGRVDAALVAFDLHRLNDAALRRLAEARTPFVILVPDRAQGEERWQLPSGYAVSLTSTPETVILALVAAIHGWRHAPAPPVARADEDPARTAPLPGSPAASSLIVVASGHGAPGRTTVATNLAAALGRMAPTVLVDADLSGPSVAAYLDADPTRNLYMLARAESTTPREWQRALEQESQPLGAFSPRASVLCGVPKPEMRWGVSERFLTSLFTELRTRYRFVIVDIGADLLGADAALHRAALRLAERVLLVAAADLVGLWHARTALNDLEAYLQVGPERIGLVLNRHDPRLHHGRSEVERALGIPMAAVVPYDHRSVQDALSTQRPLVSGRRSRAGRALRDLAERVYGENFRLGSESRRPPWKHLLGWRAPSWRASARGSSRARPAR